VKLSPDGKASAQVQAVSDDGSRVAVGVREGGADEAEIRFLDVASGEEVAERLPRARYVSLVFMPGARGVYHARHDDGTSKLREHRFGTPVESDPVLFGEGLAEGTGVGIDVSPDGKWIIASVWHGSAARKSEIHVRAVDGTGPFHAIVDDIEARFDALPADGMLYVRTTWEAPRGRILAIDLAKPDRANWKEIVPQSKHPMQDARLAGGRICARYLEDVKPVIRVFRPDGSLERVIEPEGWGSMGNVSGRWQDPEAFVSSSSWTRPLLIERVRIADGKRRRWFSAASPLAEDRFVIEQHWFTSTDGARVPLFLGRSKDAKPTGDLPTLMYGYGGFSISQLPSFGPRVAAWLAHGGIVALPSLRGGAEFGEDWHEQATLEHKQQTFDDLYGAANGLVEAGWTSPARLGIWGRSNGGLLVGAAITQRPELWKAAVCGYPLLDMVRYDKFLVAKFWVPEYGSADDADQFRTLLAYSPYHHVAPGKKYPATLFVTGDADTRVAPLHARKMAAAMQAATGSGLPVLLHYDTEMGHVGGLPADKEVAHLADELAFLAWQLDLPLSRERERSRNPGR